MQAVSFRVYSVSTRASRKSRVQRNRRFFRLEFHNRRHLDRSSFHVWRSKTDCERKARRSIATCPITHGRIYVLPSAVFSRIKLSLACCYPFRRFSNPSLFDAIARDAKEPKLEICANYNRLQRWKLIVSFFENEQRCTLRLVFLRGPVENAAS